MQRNYRTNWTCLLAMVGILLTGCAGTVKHMREMPAEQAAPSPTQGRAMVVFLRPSGLGFAIQSSVFEVTDSGVTLVGIVAAKARVAYQTDPGKHLFMAIGESADFMTADLVAGKTYYVEVTPRLGVWKARFSLDPVHRDQVESAAFKSSLADCRWVENTAESKAWSVENATSIRSKQTEYYPDWLKKPASERPALIPEDGL